MWGPALFWRWILLSPALVSFPCHCLRWIFQLDEQCPHYRSHSYDLPRQPPLCKCQSPESWRYPLHIRSVPPIAESISESTDPGRSVCSPIQRYNSGLLHFCFSSLRSPSEYRIFLNAPLPVLPLTGWCCSSFLFPCLLFLRMTVWLFEWGFAAPDLTLSHPLHHILHVWMVLWRWITISSLFPLTTVWVSLANKSFFRRSL